ncbi:MAG: diguanylate cyclase [SAR324 cluster bacterium]|nr:diguanylate cyclase [SAR324 cluster bacterium]
MMILFRRFRNFHHINKAIQVWTEGDVYIDELDQLGEKLHSTFAQENHLEESEANKKYHASIMTRTEEIDDILFELENQFSYTLGEASRWAKNLLMSVLFWGTGISGMLGFFLAWNFSKKIKENLETAVKTAQQVAQGDFNIRIQSESRDETGQLLNAMQEMVDRLHELTNIAIAVTQGNYESSVRVRSDKDLLGMALNKMLNNLHTLSEENQKQHWLDQGRAELYEAMRAGHKSEILAQDMIDFLVPSIGGQIGAVYLNHQDVMRLTASYGYPCEIMKQSFMLGEGLVGQVAKTQKTLQIDEIPADYVRIESGLGNMVPGSIVLIPFVYERQTVAVMEICFSRQPHEDRLKLLDLVSHHIAIKFIAAETRSKMMKLLEETQHQAEVLQAQQEELQVSNEELESQTRALTRSEQSLNERQLQLRAINEELARKTLVLETSQKEIQLKNEALKKSSAELEEKAKALELSNQFKSEFLANMSHELRSPLNSLLILAEILSKNKEGNLTQKQVEFARTILHSGKGLLHLINDILDLSKVEAGKLELCHEDMRFEALLASMKHEFQSIADNKGLLLSMELDQQLPRTMQTDKLADDVTFIKVLILVGMGLTIDPIQEMVKSFFARISLDKALFDKKEHDELTGLKNRTSFTRGLKEFVEIAKKEKSQLCLIFFDVDFFKKINETYSMEGGDLVLKEVGKILKKNSRDHDLVSRFWGEKFMFAMKKIDTQMGYKISERIRQDIEAHEIKYNDQVIKVTSSCGVASYPDVCSSKLTAEELIKYAEQALTYSKVHGRNQTSCAPVPA